LVIINLIEVHLGKRKRMNGCNWLIGFDFRNTLTISIANVLTSVFAGFVIFAYMGYLSYMTGQSVEEVVSEGKYFINFTLKTLFYIFRSWSCFYCLSVCSNNTSGSTIMVDTFLFYANFTRT